LRPLSFPAFGRDLVRLAPIGLRAALLESRWVPLLAGLDTPLVVSAGGCRAPGPPPAPRGPGVPPRPSRPRGGAPPPAPPPARAGATAATGPLATPRGVVATPVAKARLFARSGAVAVDMESSVIATRAIACGYPALVVRAVSDDAGQSLQPELARLVTPEGRLRWAGALALGVLRPAVLPGALGLQRRTGRARRAVARALAALIG